MRNRNVQSKYYPHSPTLIICIGGKSFIAALFDNNTLTLCPTDHDFLIQRWKSINRTWFYTGLKPTIIDFSVGESGGNLPLLLQGHSQRQAGGTNAPPKF